MEPKNSNKVGVIIYYRSYPSNPTPSPPLSRQPCTVPNVGGNLSLRKEGMSQEEVDHLFNAIVLPNFSYALPVYGVSDCDLSVIQNFLDRCM